MTVSGQVFLLCLTWSRDKNRFFTERTQIHERRITRPGQNKTGT